MLWSDHVFITLCSSRYWGTQPSKVLEGSKSAVLSEAVYQSYEGYFGPANMVRYLLEVDSLATDEGGVEVTDKSHVLVLHLWLALIHYHCCQDEVRLLLSSAFLLNLVLGYQLYSKYSGVFSPMETFVWYGHNVGKKNRWNHIIWIVLQK